MMMRRRGPGLVGMAARTAVVAGTATAVSGRVAHNQQEKYAQQAAATEQQQMAAQQAAAPAPAPAAQPDYMAELEKLAQLKNQGVITEDEFQAKKAQILGI